MWIQTVAIILPRVQQHFDGKVVIKQCGQSSFIPSSVPDSFIGYLSSSMFAGMVIGAVGWGSCMLPIDSAFMA